MDALLFEGASEVRATVQIGRLDVIASDRSGILVLVRPSNTGRAGDRSAAEATRVDRVGDTVTVTGPSRLALFGPGDSIDVVIEVPAATAVVAEVTYGTLQVSGWVGPARLSAPYGEVTVEHVERLELRSGHGDLRVDQVDGNADVVNKSGTVRLGQVGGALHLKGSATDLRVEDVAGPADVSTSSGSVEIGTVGGALSVKSAYGTVRVRELVRSSARIEGSYGNVEVGVRPGTAVWLDTSSQYGTVRTDLAADAGPAAGEESLELRIHTGYGNIIVRRTNTGS